MSFLGLPIAIWISAGISVGISVTEAWISKAINPTPQSGRLGQDDFHAIESSYYLPLPKCWGCERLAGNITWVSDVREHKYNVGGGLFSDGVDVFYYTQDVEYSFSLGPAKAFVKIWLGDKVIYDNSATPTDTPENTQSGVYGGGVPTFWQTVFNAEAAKDRLFDTYELFLGTEDQEPSAIVGAAEGYGSVPADRGVVKIVLKNVNLTKLGGNTLSAASAIIQYEDYTGVPGPTQTTKSNATSYISGGAASIRATITDASLKTGQIYRFGSASLSDTDPNIQWSSFAVPTLPSDATITGIYPFAEFSRTAKAGTSGLVGHVYLTFTSPTQTLYSATATGGEVARQVFYGTSIGTTLSAVSSYTAELLNQETLNLGTGYGDYSTVFDVGFEVRYTRPLVPPTGTTLAAIVADLCETAGFTSSQYDVSALTSIIVRGFKTEQKAIRDVLRELMEIYPFDGYESDGKLKFVLRSGSPVVTIAEDDFVLTGENESAYRLSEPITQENEIPMKLDVHYADQDRDFQDNVQHSKRIVEPEATMESITVKSINTNVVMNANEAAQAADRNLWELWAARRGGKCQVLPKHMRLDAADKITYSYKGQSLIHRLINATLGAGLGIEFTSVSHDSDVYDSSALGSSNGGTFPVPADSSADPGVVNEPVIFEPPPSQVPTGAAGCLWIQVSGADPDYAGCEAFISADGSAYTSLGKMKPGVTGFLRADFPNVSDPDTSSIISVDVTECAGTIDSASRSTADAFSNPCYVGVEASPAVLDYELICPTTSTEQDTANTFELMDYTRRGVFGSTVQDHPSGSRFAELNGCLKINLSAAWIGITLHFKFVALNSTDFANLGFDGSDQLGDCTDYTYTPVGITADTGDFYIN